MPAFLLIPAGGLATLFALKDSIRKIQNGNPWAWLFWPLAAIFAAVIAGIAIIVALVIYKTMFHRLTKY